MKTFATLFTGGDGFGVGARAAGLKSTWGVEIDPEVADWAERNDPGLRVFRGDVSEVDYAGLKTPYLLHASPQCKRASNANQQGESEEDVAQAGGVVSALRALRPPVFTLENVWGYRNFRAFKNILQALSDLGYKVDFWHLNAADYGVPQTRKRLVLIARWDYYPAKPVPTHTNPKNANSHPLLFGDGPKPWIGWYEAIEDLVPGLPESEFAPWQMARLPEELKAFLVDSDNTNFAEAKPGKGCVESNMPSNTVMATKGLPRACLVAQGGYDGKVVMRVSVDPSFTLTANHNQNGLKALLVPGDNASSNVIREMDDPSMTVVTRNRSMPRAFVVGDHNGSSKDDGRDLAVRSADEPIFTVRCLTGFLRAGTHGRVVKLTPRALARLQSVPDWYELPIDNRLACTIIGNMVPPLLTQRIVESIVK